VALSLRIWKYWRDQAPNVLEKSGSLTVLVMQ